MALGTDRIAWAGHLRGVSRAALAGTPIVEDASPDDARAWIASFEDERGTRRGIDRPLLCALLGIDPDNAPPDAPPDERVWWLDEDPTGLIRPEGATLILGDIAEAGSIEVATEIELCALHGLWRHRARAGVRERCLQAAAWHVDELDPSNATGHPWAVHVFVELAREGGPAGALFHAEGLVHGASVTLGRPGVRSACLLMDAARELEREQQDDGRGDAGA